jgi:hypothetical protein
MLTSNGYKWRLPAQKGPSALWHNYYYYKQELII